MPISNFERLEAVMEKRGAVAVALLDPDKKNDNDLLKMVQLVNDSDFDVLFVGGS